MAGVLGAVVTILRRVAAFLFFIFCLHGGMDDDAARKAARRKSPFPATFSSVIVYEPGVTLTASFIST